MQRRPRAPWCLAPALALALAAFPAHAQSAGDAVRVETDAGVIEGTLIDRLPDGYLVRSGEVSQVVPYSRVKSIVKVAPGAPPPIAPPPTYAPPAPTYAPPPIYAPPPPPTYVVPPVAPQPVVTPPSVPAPDSPPPDIPAITASAGSSRRGLSDAGTTLMALGGLGVVVGAVLSPVGAVMKATSRCHDPSGDIEFQCEYGYGSTVLYAGGVSLAAGGGVLLAGIVLSVAGRASSAPAAPTVSVGPTGGSLRWSF